jgi:hypothetical protein
VNTAGSNPLFALDVRSSTGVGIISSSATQITMAQTTSAKASKFYTDASDFYLLVSENIATVPNGLRPLRISLTNGYVGIGSGNVASYPFDLTPPAGFNTSGYIARIVGATLIYNGSTGVYVTNGGTSWQAYSDSNLKNVIEPVSNATQALETITPVYYSWKSDLNNKRQLGVIAQEIQKVIPEAVDIFEQDSNNYLSVGYTTIIPHLITAIKELSARLSNSEAMNVSLADRMAALEARFSSNANP